MPTGSPELSEWLPRAGRLLDVAGASGGTDSPVGAEADAGSAEVVPGLESALLDSGGSGPGLRCSRRQWCRTTGGPTDATVDVPVAWAGGLVALNRAPLRSLGGPQLVSYGELIGAL
ncbi:hypothetical protein NDU88_005240 [Pleurodeles waltl]|uniref:Uncharacterized protein n=1 Tax=Pleurodeles waltl TaxID=8319 RepID=A0AAV7TA45_PLEWA|nr:hypothetical protein NDU88_005240 [Pleurodeles waltl]